MQQSGKNTSTSAAEIMRFTSKRDVFTEISQLVQQSALDGYNKVCIFAYGQIVSGKAHTKAFHSKQHATKHEGIPLCLSLLSSAARELFELRAHNLVRYVVDALGTNIGQEDIKPALEAAFQRMDDEVQKEMRALRESIEVFQHTKITSMVVLVHNGWVLYAAGAANARVVMSRSFKPDDNAPSADNRNAKNAYRRTSARFGSYMDPSYAFIPVLQNRINEVACKSIAGRYMDHSKISIVITLQKMDIYPRMREVLKANLISVSTFRLCKVTRKIVP
ncbi:hypothetical protein SELMODRAFT_407327 [Selaginella moellendorffii]|uniref:Spindle pole body-associated protein Vik1/Cik1 microtubule binding domain-containing protein n=1 Tax=Selaginella moellendorffii TaxID=88036 RepID=D8R4P0_SELML|nr:hypothetical protein SELMODRAFT_407327 [Selaginella moellendorffii]